MKCIQCGTDNDYQDRQKFSSTCKKCGHQFVFEPKNMIHKMTDPQFSKIINDISVKNSLFYNPKQFTYYLDKILKSRKVGLSALPSVSLYVFLGFFVLRIFPIFLIYHIAWVLMLYLIGYSEETHQKDRQQYGRTLRIIGYIGIVVGTLIAVSVFSSVVSDENLNVTNKIFYIILIICLTTINTIVGRIAISSGRKIIQSKKPGLKTFLVKPSQMENWLEKWQAVNGRIEYILPSPSEEKHSPKIDFYIKDYSFDKLIVCDTTEIAQFLIANNFHFENNCAVLSITGYPENIFDTILEMVKQNPELKVYALHHCTPKGIGLVHHLRTSDNWFAGRDVTIYDLGLLPRQILETSDAFVKKLAECQKQAKELSPEVRQSLSQEEIEWLESGLFVELESFTPKKLLRVVSQSIKETRRLEKTSTNDQENNQERENWKIIRDDGEFAVGSSYASTIILASDSFG